jgi:4-hydroxy-4-methyl-2-oxoglutarate aldolase
MKYQIAPMPEPASGEVLGLLAGVETATIGHWRLYGFCDRRIQALAPGRVVGTAVTLAIPGADSTLLHHAAGVLRPGDILLVDRLGDDRHACWGGGVTVAVKASGAAAGIVDGPVTDPGEIADSGLPVWARGLSPITTRLYDLGGRMNWPVSIGGAVVCPGDVVLADENGVLILPAHEAEAEARRALAVQARGEQTRARVARHESPLGAISGASGMVLKGMEA